MRARAEAPTNSMNPIMTQSIHAQANALLYRALDLPSGQRPRFVAEACQSAPELLALVQTLLARIDALDALVAAPFALFAPKLPPPASLPQPQPQPGTMLAQWRLLRELGRDGEDIVFLAERDDGAARGYSRRRWRALLVRRRRRAVRANGRSCRVWSMPILPA